MAMMTYLATDDLWRERRELFDLELREVLHSEVLLDHTGLAHGAVSFVLSAFAVCVCSEKQDADL